VKLAWADGSYRGDLAVFLQEEMGCKLEIVTRRDVAPTVQQGDGPFKVLAHRWIVERTLAWIGRHRRNSKDYEHLPSSSSAWMLVAMSALMVSRAAAGAGG